MKRNILLFALLVPTLSLAQFPARLKDGLKTYLSNDSSAFIKLNFVGQVWTRYNQNNPGSTVNGELENNTFDVGLRRVRFVMSGQMTKRVAFFVQFGQNNFNYLSPRKTGAFLHDATVEYAVAPKKFNLGFGLHGWNGLGRFSNSAVSSILGLDPPIFQETTNDVNDQFVRKLGIYAKGKLGKLDYRLSVSKPFVTQTASTTVDPLTLNSSYSMQTPKQAVQGYFMYQFLDQENNFAPGTTGTYLGKKRILNLGGGFVHQDKAMWSKTLLSDNTISPDTTYHAMNLWAMDLFYDAPINKTIGTALTIYTGYFVYDFGKGYLRNVGPMNPTNGTKNGSLNGTGNGAPFIGTGNTIYFQTGYKFRDNLLGESGTLQIYSAVQYSNYDRLKTPMAVIDAGVNWLIYGHNSKFTLNYQNRPIYSITTAQAIDRKGEVVLQYQVSF
jgi:hypothetical protein